jgi:hypothetical protein
MLRILLSVYSPDCLNDLGGQNYAKTSFAEYALRTTANRLKIPLRNQPFQNPFKPLSITDMLFTD